MTLKDNLYKIEATDIDARRVELSLIPDCVIYRAHFPGRPITPGVCIIQTATELLEHLTGRPTELRGVANAKFLAVVDPAISARVCYTFKKISPADAEETIKVAVVVEGKDDSGSDITFTKLSLLCHQK